VRCPLAGDGGGANQTAAPTKGRLNEKSVREHMDMRAAYREVGSYRAAAEVCGTTPKTVKTFGAGRPGGP